MGKLFLKLQGYFFANQISCRSAGIFLIRLSFKWIALVKLKTNLFANKLLHTRSHFFQLGSSDKSNPANAESTSLAYGVGWGGWDER